ncbi:MAG TPA: hypothetical protein VJR89_38350, partial [Polyangiales bacterium]|nr:hypothetical protein [Polyangiales bacterium]
MLWIAACSGVLLLSYAVRPGAMLSVGTAAVRAYPITFLLLATLPYLAFRAARPLEERALWLVLLTGPILGFAASWLTWGPLLRALTSGVGRRSPTASQLATHFAAGATLGVVALYVLAVS